MPAQVRVLAAFLRRDWRIVRSYPLPFAMEMFSSAFILVLLFEVARLVDRAPRPTTGLLGHGYFAYVLVGMAMLQMVNSATQSFATQLREEQTTGTLEALLAAPVSPSIAILGSALYDLVKPLVLAVLMLVVGAIIGVHIALGPVALAVSVLSLAALVSVFAGLGVLVAAFTVVFKRGSALGALVTVGLALLGGVYFPIGQLPGPVRWVADILPFTWGVDVLRHSLLFGQVDGLRFAGLLGSALVILPAALWVFQASVHVARRTGTLAQY
jgi:ABC-2 type transport system permease protein